MLYIKSFKWPPLNYYIQQPRNYSIPVSIQLKKPIFSIERTSPSRRKANIFNS